MLQGGEDRLAGSLERFRAARRVVAVAILSFSGLSLVLAAAGLIGWILVVRQAAAEPPIAPSSLLSATIILGVIGLTVPFLLLALRGERKEWERVFALILEEKRFFKLMLAGSAVLVLSELALPMTVKFMLGDVVNQNRSTSGLTLMVVLLFLILILRAAAGFLRTFNAQALSYTISANLRARLYRHLQRLSYSFFDRARQGDLLSSATNDVEKLQFFLLNSSEDFFVAPLKVIGSVACVFFLDWKLAVVILVTMPVISILMKIVGGRLRKVNHAAQDWIGRLTAELSEGINTIRLAQSFGLEREEFDKFAKTNNSALGRLLSHAKLSALLLPAIEFLGFIGPVVIIAALCYEALLSGTDLVFEDLIAIAGYAGLVANPLGKLSRLMVTLSQGEAASQRIHRILETRSEIADRPGAADLPHTDGYIVFDEVSLRYGSGEPEVLSQISLEIQPGEVVAFVGESGSGKSSIVNLVPRFYDVTGGSVQLDGHDVRDLTLASLRNHIGIVSQDTILVHGTIRDNIAYGTPESDEKDIIDASMSANAHNFIVEFPDGYDTMVGERGVTLSGGQRQRIAIARALLRDPRILLLDEATSALDSVSEAVVQDALNKLMYGRTTLLVAHRLSTVRRADRIVVLSRGRIIEQGSHAELMEIPDGEYARLVKLQGLRKEDSGR
jgi:subfamily B ATP-binding cassette protein MsbA